MPEDDNTCGVSPLIEALVRLNDHRDVAQIFQSTWPPQSLVQRVVPEGVDRHTPLVHEEDALVEENAAGFLVDLARDPQEGYFGPRGWRNSDLSKLARLDVLGNLLGVFVVGQDQLVDAITQLRSHVEEAKGEIAIELLELLNAFEAIEVATLVASTLVDELIEIVDVVFLVFECKLRQRHGGRLLQTLGAGGVGGGAWVEGVEAGE